jgi:hypothetical protein
LVCCLCALRTARQNMELIAQFLNDLESSQ